MSLEWFDRVAGELQEHLESICKKYDQMGYMSVERGSKHPRIEFYVETEDEDDIEGRDYFFTLNYDPANEEFYTDSFESEMLSPVKVVLSDIEDIIDAVHEGFHDYVNGDMDDVNFVVDDDMDDIDVDIDYAASADDDEFEVEYQFADDDYDDDTETVYFGADDDDDTEVLQQIDVEWETPEVTAYMEEDEVEVTYQFGIVQETGDGVLRRVNRIWTDDDELIKDETNFIFSKEEASTIIAMIASNMDSLSEMDYQ
ncbi:hypothetical protein [Peribacillus deserti]|uniref:Uncharacterized protein n=1 Tax=Peribacillus deserti TaxID=673318 RepID=A0A2N5M886_9BACI|nr:hypothetical protein [Peribacillus deserti]PLT30578.1 hypothetical protein CUU66_06955 [Peribacillus deserti]